MKNCFRVARSVFGTSFVRALGGLLVCFCFTGCPSGSQTTSAPAPQGKIVIRGSNTVGEELAPRLIAAFRKDRPGLAVDLESKATGYGLAALMDGQCDIAAASRVPIKEEEELARDRHVEFNNYVIGAYTVAVVVNAKNTVSNLSRDQIRDIFIGKIQNWKALGGPDAPIHLYVRDPISGTYLGFRELAMENESYASGVKTATNYLGIVEAIAQDPDGIGYSSFNLTTNPGVRAVSIGGVVPSVAAVRAEHYPYMRILRLYTNKASEAPDALDFIRFVQSSRGQAIVEEMGFVGRL